MYTSHVPDIIVQSKWGMMNKINVQVGEKCHLVDVKERRDIYLSDREQHEAKHEIKIGMNHTSCMHA